MRDSAAVAGPAARTRRTRASLTHHITAEACLGRRLGLAATHGTRPRFIKHRVGPTVPCSHAAHRTRSQDHQQANGDRYGLPGAPTTQHAQRQRFGDLRPIWCRARRGIADIFVQCIAPLPCVSTLAAGRGWPMGHASFAALPGAQPDAAAGASAVPWRVRWRDPRLRRFGCASGTARPAHSLHQQPHRIPNIPKPETKPALGD